jgi:chondroitin AC lyase
MADQDPASPIRGDIDGSSSERSQREKKMGTIGGKPNNGVGAFLSVVLCVTAFPWAQNDLATVKSHILSDDLANASFKVQTEGYYGTDFSQAGSDMNSMKSNGSWSDVNYSDKTNTWSPLIHLDRMLVMAYCYSKDTSKYYKSASMLSAIDKALTYWYQVNPTCTNWFKNDICKQFYLGPIGLMLQGEITASLLTDIINDLTAAPSMTGANLTALSTSVIYRAVIEGNTTRLASGVNGLTSAIVYTSGDGVQQDNSFQQHGGILYNGNYGFGFLRDVTWVGAMVAGTQYAFSSYQIALLRGNYLDGTRWMIFRGLVDYNVRGREVGSTAAEPLGATDFVPILQHFISIDPGNTATYQASLDNIDNQLPQAVSGVRHFWSSDYTAIQRGNWCTTMKMCSKRTIGMERDVNTENLMGYWLPYGLTYIYRRGNEFDFIFPVWDWARLPGETTPHQQISWADNSTTYTSQTTSFVGGVSDSTYGVSAMDFSQGNTTAKKSWFWFDKEWVALGAGITSTNSNPVNTTLNQVLQNGSVWVDGNAFSGPAKAFTNPKWVLQDSVGYVFPQSGTVYVQAQNQSGNLQTIFGLGADTVYNANVFSLWFDHGTDPSEASYQYIVVPGTGQADLTQFAANPPVTILSNTTAVQAVSNRSLQLTGVVFYAAGQFAISGNFSVKVDNPCIVLLDQSRGVLTVSDPNETLSKVAITVVNPDGTSKSQSVTLPGGSNAGQSVKVGNMVSRVTTSILAPFTPTIENRIEQRSSGNSITFESSETITRAQVVDLRGDVVENVPVNGKTFTIESGDRIRPRTLYLVRIESSDRVSTMKALMP